MKNVIQRIVVSTALVLTFSSPVMAQDMGDRVSRMERDLETLNRAVYRGEKPPASLEPLADNSRAGLEVRLSQIEREMRQLTGTLEQQQHQVRMMSDKLDRYIADSEIRFGELQGGRTGGLITGPKNLQSSVTSQNRPVGRVPSGIQGRALPPAQLHQASPSDNHQVTETLGVLTRPTGAAVSNASGGSSAHNSTASASGVYEFAFGLIREGNYDKARDAFSRFLKDFPKHNLASNANYWLGETYYVQGGYQKAAQIFAKGYQENPTGAKAADNLLKLSLALEGMGKREDACITLQTLNKEFSGSSSPVVVRAQQELKNLSCG